MKNLSDKVAIIGMGCTKFGEHWDKSEDDLIVEAAYEAFEDAGVEPAQIEAAWVGTLSQAYRASRCRGRSSFNTSRSHASRICALPVRTRFETRRSR